MINKIKNLGFKVINEVLDKLPSSVLDRLSKIPYTEKYCYNEEGGYLKFVCNGLRLLKFLYQDQGYDDEERDSIALSLLFHQLGKLYLFDDKGKYKTTLLNNNSILYFTIKIWSKLEELVPQDLRMNVAENIEHQKAEDYSRSIQNQEFVAICNLVTKMK